LTVSLAREAHSCGSRARFEELGTFQVVPVEKILRNSKIDKSNVHEIVLVGGSTRISRIVKLVSDFFSSTERSPTRASTLTRLLPMALLSILSGDTSEKSQKTAGSPTPLSRKSGWDPSFPDPRYSTTTLASTAGYLDTPATYRQNIPDEYHHITMSDLACNHEEGHGALKRGAACRLRCLNKINVFAGARDRPI
jgi:hypothetical protein